MMVRNATLVDTADIDRLLDSDGERIVGVARAVGIAYGGERVRRRATQLGQRVWPAPR